MLRSIPALFFIFFLKGLQHCVLKKEEKNTMGCWFLGPVICHEKMFLYCKLQEEMVCPQRHCHGILKCYTIRYLLE